MTEKPKRVRRTKEQIRLDNLKIKQDKFNKEYSNMNAILTVQEVAKLLKLGIKEVRQNCIDNLYECKPHESVKNQFDIDTYQFVDHENFNNFVTKYLSEQAKQNEINQVIVTKEEPTKKNKTTTKQEVPKEEVKEKVSSVKKETKKTSKKTTDTTVTKTEEVVEKTTSTRKKKDISTKVDDSTTPKEPVTKTKKKTEKEKEFVIENKPTETNDSLLKERKTRKRKTKEDTVPLPENKTEEKKVDNKKQNSKSKKEKVENDNEEDTYIKPSNKILDLVLKKKKGNKSQSQMNELQYRQKNKFIIPTVPESVHYSVNDRVKLFDEPQLDIDVDEETFEYLEYYKKNLYGKKGVITKVEYNVDGHPIYHVWFEKQKDELLCYHHYLTWLN